MTPVTEVSVETLKRVYPHLDQVTDWAAQTTLRLLWDRVVGLEEQLTAAQATITQLVAAANTTESTAAAALLKAKASLALSLRPGEAATSAPSGTPTDGTTAPPAGTDDGGAGQIGCAAAGSSGHDTGGLLNAIRAGQITCGTGNEFSALKNPTATLAARQSNVLQLLLRMIWHLQTAGFLAGRQRTPADTIATDQLTVEVDGVIRAYRVFANPDSFTDPLVTTMEEVSPAQLLSDGGLPDS
jgi:hypothetical protein